MDSERRGRRREDWQELIAEHKRSGLTVKAFCEKQGVGEALFYSWRKRLTEEQPARFALVAPDGVVAGPLTLQLVLTGGERLEIPAGIDQATLRAVLAVLRERE
jgi:transposase